MSLVPILLRLSSFNIFVIFQAEILLIWFQDNLFSIKIVCLFFFFNKIVCPLSLNGRYFTVLVLFTLYSFYCALLQYLLLCVVFFNIFSVVVALFFCMVYVLYCLYWYSISHVPTFWYWISFLRDCLGFISFFPLCHGFGYSKSRFLSKFFSSSSSFYSSSSFSVTSNLQLDIIIF